MKPQRIILSAVLVVAVGGLVVWVLTFKRQAGGNAPANAGGNGAIASPDSSPPAVLVETNLPFAVTRVRGAARFSKDDGLIWQAVRVGDKLLPGCVVQSAGDSYLDISVDKRATLRLLESSTFRINEASRKSNNSGGVEETKLDLRAGAIYASVERLNESSCFQISCPEAVVGVRREGSFLMKASGALRVRTGTVSIVPANRETQEASILTARQQFDPVTGLVTELKTP